MRSVITKTQGERPEPKNSGFFRMETPKVTFSDAACEAWGAVFADLAARAERGEIHWPPLDGDTIPPRPLSDAAKRKQASKPKRRNGSK